MLTANKLEKKKEILSCFYHCGPRNVGDRTILRQSFIKHLCQQSNFFASAVPVVVSKKKE
jgi:hypothetical protein